MLLCCGALWAALAAAPLRAQIRIVPRAKLDSLAHPATAAGGAEAMRFERTLIDAGHFETENPVCEVLERILREAYPEIPVFRAQKHHDETQFL